MRVKIGAVLLFTLNTTLFATYYSISKEALSRIDPIIFSFFEMLTLLPVACCILLFTWQEVTKEVIKRGILIGSWLCLALFTIAIALKYTTATSTAFFPALNGFLAAIIAWLFLRHPLSKFTVVAGVLSVGGTLLLILTSPLGGWRGTTIAFLGGLFFTGYVFLSDHQHDEHISPWPLFGVELAAMAVWASLIVLLFGDWGAFHPDIPKDAGIILYVAGACTFLPTLITVLMQKHISPVTVSFIYILEPVLGAIIANLYLHETLPLLGYLGGGLVVAGAIIHTWGAARPRTSKSTTTTRHLLRPQRRLNLSFLAGMGYMLFCAGFLLLAFYMGFPPYAWREIYLLWGQFGTMQEQGQGTLVFLLWVQAIGWFVAWVAFLITLTMSLFQLLIRATPEEEPLEELEELYEPGETESPIWEKQTSSSTRQHFEDTEPPVWERTTRVPVRRRYPNAELPVWEKPTRPPLSLHQRQSESISQLHTPGVILPPTGTD